MLIVVAFVPLALCVEDVLAYDPLKVPYSNHAVVDNPFAFTAPSNVAEFVVKLVAYPVTTMGGCEDVGVGEGVGEGVGVGVGTDTTLPPAERSLSNFDTKIS